MNKKLIILIVSLFVLFFVSCAEDIPEHLPSLNDVYNVTDSYLLKDGEHLVLFNSNYDRRYTSGSISIYNIKKRISEDMVLVGSIGGKMFVDESDNLIFAATRDDGRVYGIKYEFSNDNKVLLSYIDGSKKYINTFDEPYVFASDGKYIYLGHLRNGEISVINKKTFETENTFRSYSGITDMKYSSYFGALLVAHKSSPYISFFRIYYSEKNVPSLKKFDLKPLYPFTDDDVRGVSFSRTDDSVFYMAARNGTYDTDFVPAIVKMRINVADDAINAETISYTPVYDSIGELVTVPSGNGDSELVFISAKNPDRLLIYNPDFEVVTSSVDTDRITIDRNINDSCSEICADNGNNCYVCPQTVEDFECSPYQLTFADSFRGRRLFVSCFDEDAVAVLNCDSDASSFLRFEEVIR